MKKTGDMGEEIAARYLQEHGYAIVERNWRGTDNVKCPEVDIIARKGNSLVFVEVKTSTTGKFGAPQEWITPQKRRRLAQSADAYIALKGQPEIECRIDAIVIDCRMKPPDLNHIKNAFLLSDLD